MITSFRTIRHGTIDSTNERAFEALAAGDARHGDVHIASGQTAGRGRRGRNWHSARGEGLFLSVVLKPARALPGPVLTVAAGLAVHDAVQDLGVREVELDWPNDVVAHTPSGPAKLAGILVETRGVEPEAPHYVLGVGLNVAQTAFPAELTAERAVTSLTLLGASATTADSEAAFLPRLASRLEAAERAPESLATDYLRAARLDEREVRVELAGETVEGRVRGLSFESGLRLAAGTDERVIALEHVRSLVPA